MKNMTHTLEPESRIEWGTCSQCREVWQQLESLPKEQIVKIQMGLTG